MSDILQADIFFFITSIAVILVTIPILVCLYYAMGILGDAKKISGNMADGSKTLKDKIFFLLSFIKNIRKLKKK